MLEQNYGQYKQNTSSNFWTKTARIVHSESSSKFEKAWKRYSIHTWPSKLVHTAWIVVAETLSYSRTAQLTNTPLTQQCRSKRLPQSSVFQSILLREWISYLSKERGAEFESHRYEYHSVQSTHLQHEIERGLLAKTCLKV